MAEQLDITRIRGHLRVRARSLIVAWRRGLRRKRHGRTAVSRYIDILSERLAPNIEQLADGERTCRRCFDMNIAICIVCVDVIETPRVNDQTVIFRAGIHHPDRVGDGDPAAVDDQAEMAVHMIRRHGRTAPDTIDGIGSIAARRRITISGIELVIAAADAALLQDQNGRTGLRGRAGRRRDAG